MWPFSLRAIFVALQPAQEMNSYAASPPRRLELGGAGFGSAKFSTLRQGRGSLAAYRHILVNLEERAP